MSGDREREPWIRVVLADDHPLFRDGIRRILLDGSSAYTVVGESSTSSGVVNMVEVHRPDLVLLDVQIDETDVTSTVRSIRVASPRTHVIILTMHDDPSLVASLVELGIRGYLLKSIGWRELIAALDTILADPHRIIVSTSEAAVSTAVPGDKQQLSKREFEVLTLAAHALTNRQIGTRLAITEPTVKKHLHNVFDKLGATSRIDAVNKALALGIIRSSPTSFR